jgi:hypothetical protein
MDTESLRAMEQITNCEFLYLNSLERVPFWGLRVVTQEMLPQGGPENLERDFEPKQADRIRASLPLKRDPRRFEFVWKECVSYLVTNECYGKYPEPPELFEGKLFRVFSWSYLLEMSRKITYASEEHPGPEPLQHFEIVCSDDVVDVIACMKPVIRQIT